MKYFELYEFDCKCGCGLNNMSAALLAFLDDLREKCEFPFYIRSGSRCEHHNKEVGGKPWSDHLTGEGVDIKITTSQQWFKIIFFAIHLGFKRVGMGETFVHLGIKKTNTQAVMWFYPK